MTLARSHWKHAFWGVTMVLLGALAFVVFYFTPIDQDMGPIQKIFYLHLPVAINAVLPESHG